MERARPITLRPPRVGTPPLARGRAVLLRRLLTLLVPLASAAGPVAAQTLTLAGGVAGDAGLAHVAVREVPRGGGTVGLAAVLSPAPGLDLEVRGARAFGPLGTLTLEADAGVRVVPELRGRLRLTGRGSFGPLAGRLEARAWGAPAERFDPLGDPGPALGDTGVSLRLAAEGRADRTWLLGGDLRGEWSGRAVVDGWARARARRLLGPEWDLELRAGGRLADAGDGRSGVGVGVTYAPRRAPEIGVVAYLDLAPAAEGPAGDGGVRVAPGLEAHGARPVAGGRLAWRLRSRPLAPERAPWFLSAEWSRPLDLGTLRLTGSLRHGGGAGTRAALALAYERALDGW